jgi:hypothetical protein
MRPTNFEFLIWLIFYSFWDKTVQMEPKGTYNQNDKILSLIYISIEFIAVAWSWSYGSWIYNYLCNQCLSPLMLWVRISIRARCTTLCDKVCQWLATGRWFSPGPPVSSTHKTDHHDIPVTEILFKLALSTFKQTNKQTNIPLALTVNNQTF